MKPLQLRMQRIAEKR